VNNIGSLGGRHDDQPLVVRRRREKREADPGKQCDSEELGRRSSKNDATRTSKELYL
jgi:hypothetical protein